MASQCEYYPCHSGFVGEFSCEFCYCPEYKLKECSGTPKWIVNLMGDKIKDCSDCLLPHTTEYVNRYYKEKQENEHKDC